MTIIHTSSSKQKPKKLNAKQRELQAEWEKMLSKYTPNKTITAKSSSTWVPSKPHVRETPKIPSLNTGFHDCSKKETPVYTGTMIKGIGTMHKSNAIPIFSDDHAVEIARMRRG